MMVIINHYVLLFSVWASNFFSIIFILFYILFSKQSLFVGFLNVNKKISMEKVLNKE